MAGLALAGLVFAALPAGAGAQDSSELAAETVGILPQLGVLIYEDIQGSTTSRAVGGIGLDYNVGAGLTGNPRWYIGPSTGALYSHLGSATSNFFGTDPTATLNDPGANLLIIPVNLKIGYNFPQYNFRVALHGGANVLFRSSNTAIDLGSDNSGSGIAKWNIFPNAGGDIEIGLGKGVALSLRPDITVTPGVDFFTGTVALNLALG